MVKTLPEDFDVSSEWLDVDETVIRDELQLNVSGRTTLNRGRPKSG